MELRLIARILLRWWWLVVIPVAVVAVFTVPDMLSGPSSAGGYSTVLRYSAAQQPEALPPRDGDFQDVWLASEYTVNALTSWVQTSSFREEVAQAAAVDINQAALGITADNDRSVGQLFLSYPVADDLAVIADAALTVLQTRTDAYFPQMGSAPAVVTVLDEVVVTAAPPPLTNRFAPFLRLGIGLLAGLGLAFLAHYLDPYLRERRDVENLGLNVVAQLPRS